MPILKKFCFCFSLRTGALIIAYSSLFIDITDGVWTMYNKEKFCFKILIIMIISSIWNVVSDMILITAIYRYPFAAKSQPAARAPGDLSGEPDPSIDL
ncbi:uncharacterized protein LOC108138076 isoform X2 [Drosophila elegans]|uniref:uncharacterized protein LOC108138076 isoform X2 n=1 Tax=Drosophila elegans TaxID=30023 RepID=UPI0007E82B5C|nr:uncharacterized protein LOC108138076 isoform X2 [Drosophila elegans]